MSAINKLPGYFPYNPNIIISNITSNNETVYVYSPQNIVCFPSNFMNSIAYCGFSPNDDFVLTILLNASQVGTVTFKNNSNYGVFAMMNNLIMNTGDFDYSIADICLTLKGIVYIPPISFTNLPSVIPYSQETLTVGGIMVSNISPIIVGLTQSNSSPPTSWVTAEIGDQMWSANIPLVNYTLYNGNQNVQAKYVPSGLVGDNFTTPNTEVIVWVQYENDPSACILGQFMISGYLDN